MKIIFFKKIIIYTELKAKKWKQDPKIKQKIYIFLLI